jgi:hypothetical protein
MTPEQKIKYFISECKRFVDFFGLHDWQIYYEPHDEDEGARAMCTTDAMTNLGGGMIARLSWSVEWIKDKGTDKRELSVCAFHEVLELMLSLIRDYATNKNINVSQREVDNEIHRLIRRFENKVFPLL